MGDRGPEQARPQAAELQPSVVYRGLKQAVQ